MAVPRPILLIAVLGAALMAATFYAVRGARETAVNTPAPSSVTRSVPSGTGATKHKAAPTKHAGARAKHKSHGKSPSGRGTAARKAAAKGLPADVARALDKRHIIVLLFFRPGAADDSATKRSVAAVRHAARRVSVFSAPISKLSRYRRAISGLDISSAPATVVVGRDRKARVLEGFLDSGTLAQEVADTKR
jgi:hypothetical protein